MLPASQKSGNAVLAAAHPTRERRNDVLRREAAWCRSRPAVRGPNDLTLSLRSHACCNLVVPGLEVGGRFGREAAAFPRQLAKARARASRARSRPAPGRAACPLALLEGHGGCGSEASTGLLAVRIALSGSGRMVTCWLMLVAPSQTLTHVTSKTPNLPPESLLYNHGHCFRRANPSPYNCRASERPFCKSACLHSVFMSVYMFACLFACSQVF